MTFDRFVAGRYLRAKRKQAFIGVISMITLLGITLGVTALNLALAIHNGMHNAFVESLVGSTGNLHILAGRNLGGGFSDENLDVIRSVVEQIPNVVGVSEMISEPAVLISRNKRLGYGKLHGIRVEDHLRASDTLRDLRFGDAHALENRPPGTAPGVILGYDLARTLGVDEGDTIQVAVPRLASPGLTRRGLRLKELKVEVVGIFKTGFSQFDETDAYLQLDQLKTLLNTRESTSILVNFNSRAALDHGKAELLNNPVLPLGAIVMDFRDLNQSLLQALKLEKAATTAVISLFILIVALNMVSALTMLVMEKHRDIGIMKSFGTPAKTIERIFLRQGMTLAAGGTLLGTLLGVGLAVFADRTQLIKLDNHVYEVLNYLPFQVAPHEVLLVALGAMLLSFVSCLYPARQAANLNPVEALKYD